MKALDSFTVERLEGLIGDAETWSFVKVPARELKALARIALSAKRAEPVAYWNDACDLDDGAFSYANDAGCTRPLYDTPQLNSPEIPEDWISIPRDMLADYRDVKNAEVENYKAGFAGYYDQEGTRWARDFADLCEELAAIDKELAAAPEKPL